MPKRKAKQKTKYESKKSSVVDLLNFDFPKFEGFDNKPSNDEKINAWLEKRRGYFTASKAGAIMSFDFTEDEVNQLKGERESIISQIAESKTGKTKTLESKLGVIERKIKASEELPKGAISVAMGVVIGRLTKFNKARQKPINTPAIAWGNACELDAIDCFSKSTGFTVSKTGENQEFIECKDDALGGFVGCTPDGIIDINGEISGVEIKCPESINHLENLKMKNQSDLLELHPDYYWQIMMQMMCTGAKTWHFCSFDPDFRDESKRMIIIKVQRDNESIARLKNRLNRLVSFVLCNLENCRF